MFIEPLYLLDVTFGPAEGPRDEAFINAYRVLSTAKR